MIPLFPKFKPIEISDREDVENFTKNFPPYSDFNFISMWSWNTKDEMELSQLNNNLVVKFTDYITGEPFYSFIGTNQTKGTVEELISHGGQNNIDTQLKLIPHHTAEDLKVTHPELHIYEDHDHSDYIYSIKLLTTYEGSLLKNHRNALASLNRKYSNSIRSDLINISELHRQSEILDLYKIWESKKDVAVPNEFIALKKCISGASVLPIFCIGVYFGDKLIGFSINQIENEEFATCFFAKGNVDYYGVYSYLINQTAIYLHEKGIAHLNYEQDLGLTSLRKSKNTFAPVYFLKKCSLTKID